MGCRNPSEGRLGVAYASKPAAEVTSSATFLTRRRFSERAEIFLETIEGACLGVIAF